MGSYRYSRCSDEWFRISLKSEKKYIGRRNIMSEFDVIKKKNLSLSVVW